MKKRTSLGGGRRQQAEGRSPAKMVSEIGHLLTEMSDIHYRLENVALGAVRPDPDNPRELPFDHTVLRQFPDGGLPESPEEALVTGVHLHEQWIDELTSLLELAHTIHAQGVVNPAVGYRTSRGPEHYLIAGERRFLGSHLAGKTHLPMLVYDGKPERFVIAVIQWLENHQRRGLPADKQLREFERLYMLLSEKEGSASITDLTKFTGLSRAMTSHWLAVARGDGAVRELVYQGYVTNIKEAAMLARIDDDEARARVIEAKRAGVDTSAQLLRSQTADAGKHGGKAGRRSQNVRFPAVKQVGAAQAIVEALLGHPRVKRLGMTKKEVREMSVDELNEAVQRIWAVFGEEGGA